MKTVKIEQMYPTREFIDVIRFDDRNKTISELTEMVNRYVEVNLWDFKEQHPSMTELRWEYEDIGQGHYTPVPTAIEPPITWVGQLTYEQLIDVLKRATEIEDWSTVEHCGYQLRLLKNRPYTHISWSEFVLPVDDYKFDWMDIDDEDSIRGKVEEIEEPTEVGESVKPFRADEVEKIHVYSDQVVMSIDNADFIFTEEMITEHLNQQWDDGETTLHWIDDVGLEMTQAAWRNLYRLLYPFGR